MLELMPTPATYAHVAHDCRHSHERSHFAIINYCPPSQALTATTIGVGVGTAVLAFALIVTFPAD